MKEITKKIGLFFSLLFFLTYVSASPALAEPCKEHENEKPEVSHSVDQDGPLTVVVTFNAKDHDYNSSWKNHDGSAGKLYISWLNNEVFVPAVFDSAGGLPAGDFAMTDKDSQEVARNTYSADQVVTDPATGDRKVTIAYKIVDNEQKHNVIDFSNAITFEYHFKNIDPKVSSKCYMLDSHTLVLRDTSTDADAAFYSTGGFPALSITLPTGGTQYWAIPNLGEATPSPSDQSRDFYFSYGDTPAPYSISYVVIDNHPASASNYNAGLKGGWTNSGAIVCNEIPPADLARKPTDNIFPRVSFKSCTVRCTEPGCANTAITVTDYTYDPDRADANKEAYWAGRAGIGAGMLDAHDGTTGVLIFKTLTNFVTYLYPTMTGKKEDAVSFTRDYSTLGENIYVDQDNRRYVFFHLSYNDNHSVSANHGLLKGVGEFKKMNGGWIKQYLDTNYCTTEN